MTCAMTADQRATWRENIAVGYAAAGVLAVVLSMFMPAGTTGSWVMLFIWAMCMFGWAELMSMAAVIRWRVALDGWSTTLDLAKNQVTIIETLSRENDRLQRELDDARRV